MTDTEMMKNETERMRLRQELFSVFFELRCPAAANRYSAAAKETPTNEQLKEYIKASCKDVLLVEKMFSPKPSKK